MGGIVRNPCVDSMKLAQAHHEYRRRFRAWLCQPVHIVQPRLARQESMICQDFEQHDALEDALQTAYLFLFLVSRLRDAGYVTLNDLHIAGRYQTGHYVECPYADSIPREGVAFPARSRVLWITRQLWQVSKTMTDYLDRTRLCIRILFASRDFRLRMSPSAALPRMDCVYNG